jgi:UDP-N-acetylmuramyl pentapeptide phosphotransferase/UDP-N-acetylglucosamine-1-phosphate transferase
VRSPAILAGMLVLAAFLAALAVIIAGLVKAPAINAAPRGLLVGNYRGNDVPAVGGIVILSAFLAVEAFFTLVSLVRPGRLAEGSNAFSPSAVPATFVSADHYGLIVVVFGFFMLGLIDDLAGAGHASGFKGHAAALLRGEVTGGAIKAAGGVAVGLIAGGLWELKILPAVLDALVVALAANLVNLLDRRPGRATKAFFVVWAPLAASAWSAPYFPISSVVAAAAGAWMAADLSEKGMLGDSGSNLLGAVVGAGLALTLGVAGKLIVLAVLIALTVASEKWSFTDAIERVAPLRFLDSLGCPPKGGSGGSSSPPRT